LNTGGDRNTTSDFTIKTFDYYLIVLGAVLILVPNILLKICHMASTTEVRIRVVGVLVFMSLFYTILNY